VPWSGSGWRRFVPQPTVQARPRIGRFVEELPARTRWIDLGAGGRRLRDAVRVDRDFGEPVEVLADAPDLPFRDGVLDAVVTTGTLEHLVNPDRVLQEVARALRPGGLVYVEVPFLQGYHADPDDFWRFTENGLRLLLQRNGFRPEESGAHMGPFSAVTWILSEALASAFGTGILRRPGTLAARCVVWPVKFLDYAAMSLPSARRIACGVWAIATKPAAGGLSTRGAA
jgi:SAM-dependent methyltransferase